ncbi:MAG: hypothetical protein AB4290_16915 [Spirulina sp.]
MQTIAKSQPTAYPPLTKPTVKPKHRLTAVWFKDPQTGQLYCKWFSTMTHES